jgi:hypothetical protein
MEKWKKIDSALDSELENFDRLMTATQIDGEKAETPTEKELHRIENILERSMPERFVQEKLLEEHLKRI